MTPPVTTHGLARLARGLLLGLLLGWAGRAVAVSPPPMHQVGAGDELTVQVYGEPELSGAFRITPACFIELQFIGWIQVCGRTTTELTKAITAKLADGYLVHPSVVVRVSEYGSRKVEVKGHVTRPGLLVLDKPTTVSEAITLAGGPLSESVVEALVISGENRATYSLTALESGLQTVWLTPGDIVVLRSPSTVQVIGEVEREGPVPYRQGLTVTQALGLAGGPSEFASTRRCWLVRSDGSQIKVNVRRITKGRDPDLVLQADDKLVIRRSVF